MNEIKIAIIEDLREVATGLKDLINDCDNLSCSQVYHNAEDAMTFLVNSPVDIVIVDIGLPRASGIDAIQFLSQQCGDTVFCMFTVYDDDEKIFTSLQAGAKGYILKNTSSEKIIESISELYEGGSPMSPTIARRIIDVFKSAQIKPTASQLPVTDRELQLLDLLSKGFLYKEIGDNLGITIGTVKQHIHKIYDKLQVSNRTEAINMYKDRY